MDILWTFTCIQGEICIDTLTIIWYVILEAKKDLADLPDTKPAHVNTRITKTAHCQIAMT